MSDSFRINTLLYATALKKQLTCCPGITIGMTSGTTCLLYTSRCV